MQTFSIEKDGFRLNGEPFRIIAGAIHYFRVPAEYWRDRLIKLKACGFNTVETYIAWNLHEKNEGEFDYSDMLDFERFLEIAAELGLYAIVRPGPYLLGVGFRRSALVASQKRFNQSPLYGR